MAKTVSIPFKIYYYSITNILQGLERYLEFSKQLDSLPFFDYYITLYSLYLILNKLLISYYFIRILASAYI